MAYVYVLRNGSDDLFKIGRTKNDVGARIRQLSTGNPQALVRFDVIETAHDKLCESYLHGKLWSRRVLDGAAREFFAIAPADLVPMIEEARDYLREYSSHHDEVDNLASADTNGSLLTASNEVMFLYSRLQEIHEIEDRCWFERQLHEQKLKITIGTADGINKVATWKTRIQTSFDESAFRLAHPGMYESFRTKVSRTRTFKLV